MNFSIQNKLQTQSKRLSWIISQLEITPYQFSKNLEYKTPDSIYHVLNNNKEINNSLALRIKKYNSNINTDWLVTGWGDPFNYQYQFKEIISSGLKIIYPARLDFRSIKKLALALSGVVFDFPDEESFSVQVRKCAIEGLEFNFTTYNYYNNEKTKEKYYSIILQPDWKISIFFDFWRVEEISRRCQNLLSINKNLTDSIDQRFQNTISEFLLYLEENYSESNIEDEMFDFYTINSEYIELFSTDCR